MFSSYQGLFWSLKQIYPIQLNAEENSCKQESLSLYDLNDLLWFSSSELPSKPKLFSKFSICPDVGLGFLLILKQCYSSTEKDERNSQAKKK